MKTKRVAKHALFTSVLALVLCVSMLVGTTFAWFTDSVTSKNNVIKAGNLDVTLEYKTAGMDDWAEVKEDTALFSEDSLWEPGHTEYVYLRVSNVGTLAVKYILSAEVYSETEGTNVYNEKFLLSDHLKYGVVKDFNATTREAAVAEAVNAMEAGMDIAGVTVSSIGENFSENPLKAGESVETALIITMPTTVENEANHLTGTEAPKITFGVNLYATQLVHEEDSFGPDYDADAFYGSYEDVTADDNLADVMAGAMEGQELVMVLSADTTWETAGTHGEKDVTAASGITIDGQGKYTLTATGSGVTPIGDSEAPLTLKNLTVSDKSVSYNESAWEFGYLELGGSELICENVVFTDPIMVESQKATFVNCTFTGYTAEMTMYGVWMYNGEAEFINCTFEGTRGMKICDMYASEVSTVVIDGCTFDNLTEKPGVAIDDEDPQDMDITIKNSTFINCQPGDQGLYVYETDNTEPTVENNTVLNNATIVNTAEDLLALSGKAFVSNNSTADEAVVVINDDIDLGGADFSAMVAQRGDTLTVLGNGHTISNVNVVSGTDDNSTGQASMFYVYSNATLNVSDLTLKNLKVTSDEEDSGYAAAVIGYCEGTAVLDNVDVVNAEIIGVKSSGALVGHLSNGASVTATGCDLSGSVTLAEYSGEAEGHYAGKYIGTLAGTAALNNCTADVTVSGSLKSGNVGTIYGRNLGTLTVDGATEVSDGFATDASGNMYVSNENGLAALNAWYKSNSNSNRFGGKSVNITADIDAVNVTWDCVEVSQDSTERPVGIIFNGNGHSIKNLTISGSGLFTKNACKSTFSDITFDNVTVNGGWHTGVVWGQVYGEITLENVNVVNSKVSGTCNVGGLVGRNGDEGHTLITFDGCSVTNTTVTSNGGGDNCGASAFLGMALKTGAASLDLTFSGTNTSEGNALNSAAGHQGGGIYAKATWGDSTWDTPVVVTAFDDYNNQ